MSNPQNRREFFSLRNLNSTTAIATLTLIVTALTLIASFTIPEIRLFLGLDERPIENSLDAEAKPCEAQIIVSTAEGSPLNQVKVLPRRDAPSRPPATQGMSVTVDDQPGTGWVRISYTNDNANHSGWIQDRYLELLGGCS